MIVNLSTDQTRTVEPMRSFVEGIELAEIAGAYALISRTLERVLYPRLGKAGKGAVKRFLEKATSLSRSQVTRLIGQHRRSRDIRDHREKPPARPFPRRYTPGDIALLAEVDEAYGQLSGPATMEVLRRHYEVHGDERFQRLASISNIPLLEALITAFPVTVEAFHADNGSEYINHRVAELLTKLHIGTFTKSRARRSNDNALVESRNGSVVRKWLGHIYVPAPSPPGSMPSCATPSPLSSTSTGRACCPSTSQAPPAVLSESAIPRPGSLYPVQPVAQLDRCQGFPQARPAATSEALDQSALTKFALATTDLEAAQDVQLARDEVMRTLA